jgi:hypothetical protein
MKLNLLISRFSLCVLFALASVATLRAESPATFNVGDCNFTRPTSWEWVEPSSSMRKAQLKVTDAASKTSADVVFFEFGGGGAGGVQANVDRWLRQFSEPREKLNSKQEEVTVRKTKITYVSAEGTFSSGMPGGPTTPMTDYALQGAIIESEGGSVFVKMTGPKALVKASVAEFKKMVESGPKKNNISGNRSPVSASAY